MVYTNVQKVHEARRKVSWLSAWGDLGRLHVPLHVEGEVVGAGEGSLAQVALERPVSGVFPEVPCELVRPGELPAAAFPVAVIWLFTCVRPHVSFEVGALRVRFPASGKLAVVRRGTLPRPRPAPSLLLDRPGVIVRVEVHEGWRGWRGEHRPLVVVVRVQLSVLLGEAWLCVMGWIRCVMALLVELFLVHVLQTEVHG